MEGWFHGCGMFWRADGMKYEGQFRGGRIWGLGTRIAYYIYNLYIYLISYSHKYMNYIKIRIVITHKS